MFELAARPEASRDRVGVLKFPCSVQRLAGRVAARSPALKEE